MNLTVDEPARARGRRRRAKKTRHWADAACEALLVTVVVGSALAIGTVHMPALLVVAALALSGGLLGAQAMRRLPAPAIVLGLLGLFSALQAVPLPAGLVSRLSPVSAQIWLRSLAPFGQPALTSFPVSLDAGASVAEALKWLSYAAVYVMAVRVRSFRGSAWLAVLLFSSVALVAFLTLLHGVADLRLLYGVYEPNFATDRWSVGPLLNSNNFAGYALVGLFTGAGLLFGRRSAALRVPLLIGLGVIFVALLLSGSRAAILSTVACGLVVLVWLTKAQGFRLSARRLLLGVTPLVLGVLIAVGLGTAEDLRRLASLDVQRKVAIWSWSLPMIREHGWLGVGRGAFETAFPPYRQALDYDWTAVASHAENFVIQWIAEWGLPVGLGAALVIVGYVLREWRRATGDRMRFMLLAGLAALLLQNLADLGLEVPAVAIAAVVLLAAAERRAPSASEPRIGPAGFAAAVPLFAVWVAALRFSAWPVEVERREVAANYHALQITSAGDRSRFRDDLRGAVLRHPGESFFPLLGALVAHRSRDGNPLPWISRALELAPSNGRVHLVLAELLAAHRATEQAMLHLRLAAAYDGTLAGTAGVYAAEWAPSVDVLMQAVPPGPAGDAVLALACVKTRPELRIDCLRRAGLHNPQDALLRGQLAESLLAALHSGQPPCTPATAADCAQEAEQNARGMAKLDPKSWRPRYLIAKIFLARGDAKGAASLLAKACPPDATGEECAREAVNAAIASGSEEATEAAATAYAARGCEDSASCAENLDRMGTTLEAAGKHVLAITYYRKAAETEGTAARWLRVADRSAQAGLVGAARLALERADRSPDASENSRAHTEQLRLRLARGALAGPL